MTVPTKADLDILERCLEANKRARRFLVIGVAFLIVGMLGTLTVMAVQVHQANVRYDHATNQRAELKDLLQNCVRTQ